jgi:hypothetical protein
MKAWGSSPLLDPYYSSAHFRIQHHGSAMSRLDKTSLVADWHTGLQNIRVCQKDPSGHQNCGSCEKCIRTMAALVSLGKLDSCDAFPAKDLSADLLSSVKRWDMISSEYQLNWYREMTNNLLTLGRQDLVSVIRDFVLYFEKRVRKNDQGMVASD